MSPFLLRGGPLEIPGGGVKIPPKKFMENEKCLEKLKIRAAITSEKKKSCKQTAKCKQSWKKILAEVKCIKQQRHETEKKIVPQEFYTPLQGFLMVRP